MTLDGLKWVTCLAYLREGNYEKGWPEHEWIRTGNPEFKGQYVPTPTFGHPIWHGQKSRVLVNADFGIGDTIFFWRYFLAAREKAANMMLRCDSEFKPLFGDCVIDKEGPLPEFDHIIHMMCLPRFVDKAPNQYLDSVINNEELSFMDDLGFTKIGVCASGNPFNPRDDVRSIPNDLFECLRIKEGMPLFGLVRHEEPPEFMYDMRRFMKDWAQTAHLISKLDIVISVDTAIAHLAGAMGKQVWLLLPKKDSQDWRWNGTKWYPHMTIFEKHSNWEEVIDRVREELQRLDDLFV